MSDAIDPQLLRLTLLLQLERRARQAPAEELPYIVVNETADLIPYRQALLWRRDLARLEAASGVASPEKNSPYALWLTPMLRYFSRDPRAASLVAFDAGDLPEELARDWTDWAPEHGLWVPSDGAFGRLSCVGLIPGSALERCGNSSALLPG